MNDNLVNSAQKITKTVFIRTFASVFCVALIIGTINVFLLPKTFTSTSRVHVSLNNSGMADASIIQNETNLIRSESVLGRAIKQMDLGHVWGKRYGEDNFNVSETMKLLNAQLNVHPVENSGLIEIEMYDGDREEASWIANTIAEVYSGYHNNPEGYGAATSNVKVEIVDRAMPAIKPARPNVPLEILRNTFAEILIALAAAGVVAWFAWMIARSPKISVAKPLVITSRW